MEDRLEEGSVRFHENLFPKAKKLEPKKENNNEKETKKLDRNLKINGNDLFLRMIVWLCK